MSHSHSHEAHDPTDLLKSAGLKITDQRKRILTFLLENHGPFTVEEMAQGLKSAGFDLATIYRNMTAFEEAKLVQKVHFGDGTIRWEIHQHACEEEHTHSGHHHHILCTVCKKILPLDICLSSDTLAQVAKLGYGDLKHNLEFSGICPQCRKKTR